MHRRSDNRRGKTRFSIDVDGYYYFNDQWQKCRIYDLNLEGAGLRLNQFFIKDDVIKLKFGFEHEQNVFETIVANVNGPRIGVKFNGLDDFDREFIRKVINENSTRYKIN